MTTSWMNPMTSLRNLANQPMVIIHSIGVWLLVFTRAFKSPDVSLLKRNPLRGESSVLTSYCLHLMVNAFLTELLEFKLSGILVWQTVVNFLKCERQLLHKLLFAEKAKETLLRASLRDKARVTTALGSGSTKRMVQPNIFIPLPLAVTDLDDANTTHCNPELVKATTREYFCRLYDHSRILEMPKPWLKTLLVQEVHERVAVTPFLWPCACTLNDFCALLRCGNHRPSPGPDLCMGEMDN